MRPQSKTFEVAVHNREVRAALGEAVATDNCGTIGPTPTTSR